MYIAPSDEKLKALLSEVKSIAVIGAVDKPGRPVDMVGRYLIEAGFSVYPVHPKRSDVWGLTTYADVRDIHATVDLVNIFRAPEHCPGHAREVLEMAMLPKIVWLQSGITSAEACTCLGEKGITYIQDRCLMVEHRRLFV
jgi:hypothetical protein